ncbi:hypothetical protein MKX01_004631, partial [Papaver californicum]
MGDKKEERTVCCTGDIHGYYSKLRNHWSNLEALINPNSFQQYPKQTHVFLCGNHDLAFSEFFKDDVCIEISGEKKHCKLVAVHAGLEKAKGVEEQLKVLKVRDTKIPKVAALSGRKDELTEKPTIVVRGHHGKLYIEELRLIIDEGGGYEQKPVAAIVLPSMKIIRDTELMM